MHRFLPMIAAALAGLTAFAVSHLAEAGDSRLQLVADGRARAQIVVPANPQPVEQHAAEELQKYILQMSGAKLPIGSAVAKEGVNIYIGSAAPSGRVDLSEAALGRDGYVVEVSDKDVILAGVESHSCLYAVYQLLERHLGCGFFEDGDQVPRQATVELPIVHDVAKPRFDWRICYSCMQDAYSGMRWWDWPEMQRWVDWMAKKRFNMWQTERIPEYCGIGALAAGKLGIPIELTAWQRKRSEVLRRTFDYARMLGIRIVYNAALQFSPSEGAPGVSAYSDRVQLEEFVSRWNAKAVRNEDKIPLLPYGWCGMNLPLMDPRHPATKQFVTAAIQAYAEALGTDHYYILSLPQEGGLAQGNAEEKNDITYNMVMGVVDAIRAGDAQATIIANEPYAYGDVYDAMKRARRDAKLPIQGDPFLNMPGRLHGYVMHDYYWGQPWTIGFFTGASTLTNPNGDLRLAIRNAKNVASDPKATKLIGSLVFGESNHRNIVMNDLFTELTWDPAIVDAEDYLRRFTARRYGVAVASRLQPATDAIANTLLTCDNMDIGNHPLYRSWGGGYLPGLTATSVKRTMSWLPELCLTLETLLAEHTALQGSGLYRFDLVDYGRTYLAATFNDRLARARKALRVKDKAAFESAAKDVEEVMHFMARYCSAAPQFRLKTHDDWAANWPEIVPGHNNKETNWITFTWLTSRASIVDYMAEDYAELIEHYFCPRVLLYLDEMRKLLAEGKDISGRLGGLQYRVSDWAPPQGELPWSPYGPPCEPELKGGDRALLDRIVTAGSVSGKFAFYEGPMDKLVRELLDRWPVPQDLPQILSERDSQMAAIQEKVADIPVGSTTKGFRTPGVVEQVRVPDELGYLVTVEKLSATYNIARGPIASYRVVVSDYLSLTRVTNVISPLGTHQCLTLDFESRNKKYRLVYDVGSDHSPAGLYIDPQ